MKICVIIPVRNRKDCTLECLSHLATLDPEIPFYIFLIDDGSSDGTPDAVRREYPFVKLVHGDGNLWWGGAVRLGLEVAMRDGGTHFMLLNDDCRPSADGWGKIVENMLSHSKGIFLADVYSRHNPPVRLNNVLLAEHIQGPVELDRLRNSTGQCVGFSRQLIEDIGLPRLAGCRHYTDGVFFPTAVRHGYDIFRVNGAKAICDWEALRALEPYDRLLLSPISFANYLQFCLFHEKSRYKITTRVMQMIARHGCFKGLLFACLRYGIFIVESMRSVVYRSLGLGKSQFIYRVSKLPSKELQMAVTLEAESGAPIGFS